MQPSTYAILTCVVAILAGIVVPRIWHYPFAFQPKSVSIRTCNRTQIFLLHYASVDCIPVKNWPVNLTEVELSRTPVVIRDSPAKEMKALKSWKSYEYLSRHIPLLTNVLVSDSRIFSYFDAKKRKRWAEVFPGIVKERAAHVAAMNMTASEFLRNVSAPVQAENWLYYSHYFGFKTSKDVQRDGEFGRVANDLDLEFLVQDLDVTTVKANVWSAAAGVITNTHYDGANNYFVQVVGTKTFVLSPPRSFERMHLFPHGHPSDRQSQQGKKKHPFSSITALVADLEPGDVLYVPPLWFHRVFTTRSASIGVNLWIPAMEDELLSWLHSFSQIPRILTEKPSPETDAKRVNVGVELLRQLALLASSKDKQLLTSIFEQRYAMLRDSSKCTDKTDKDKCPKKSTKLTAEEEDEVKQVIKSVKNILGEAEKRIGAEGKGVRDLVLTDFIESIAEHIVGTGNVCLFLFCVGQKEAWSEVV